MAGFAGSHLAELLVSQDVEVHGLVMPGDSLRNLEGIRTSPHQSRLHALEADLVQGERLAGILEATRPDRVYHLAAVSSVRQSQEDPSRAFQVNVLGTRNLLEAIRLAGIQPRILLVSSADAYGESAKLSRPLREEDPLLPVSPYGVSKAAAEAVACHYGSQDGLHLVRVRPFPHTGPRQAPQFVLPDWAMQLAEIEAGRRPPTLLVGNLDVQRDISDVRDVVRAYVLALEHGEAGAAYNVCSGQVYGLQAVLGALIGLTGIAVEIRSESGRVRSRDLAILQGSCLALHARTGWKATIPLDRTLEDLLAYWRAERGGGLAPPHHAPS